MMGGADGSTSDGRDESAARRERVRAHIRTVLRRLSALGGAAKP
ncbi:hypothetical protein J2X36_004952 [Methylobacterium sp. BE186]|nr:hypothetical protein [Methylobacterium sp. BE186]MDR7040171.1 hypothetical protein [Methylobacterium sp. BE186]